VGSWEAELVMAKRVRGNAVDVTKAQLEERAKQSLTTSKPAQPRPSLTMCASTEPALRSQSHQSPTPPSHRPTLQHHTTSETLAVPALF